MIEDQIKKLNERVIKFSHHVQKMLEHSLDGLSNRNIDTLESVISKKEHKANKYDNSIEKRCVAAIAQFSPKAINLRLILMILKMNKDLERMADHCVNISLNARDIIQSGEPFDEYTGNIKSMGRAVEEMLRKSITSFVDENPPLAREVCDKDNEVNHYQHDLIDFFIGKMKDKPENANIFLNFINIINNLERIADLSTNLAEDVVFIFQGKVIKH